MLVKAYLVGVLDVEARPPALKYAGVYSSGAEGLTTSLHTEHAFNIAEMHANSYQEAWTLLVAYLREAPNLRWVRPYLLEKDR